LEKRGKRAKTYCGENRTADEMNCQHDGTDMRLGKKEKEG